MYDEFRRKRLLKAAGPVSQNLSLFMFAHCEDQTTEAMKEAKAARMTEAERRAAEEHERQLTLQKTQRWKSFVRSRSLARCDRGRQGR